MNQQLEVALMLERLAPPIIRREGTDVSDEYAGG
jgi:hypothetical protein